MIIIGRSVRRVFRRVTDIVTKPVDRILGTNISGRNGVPDVQQAEAVVKQDDGGVDTVIKNPTTQTGGTSDSKFDIDSIFKVNTDSGQASNPFDEVLRKRKAKK